MHSLQNITVYLGSSGRCREVFKNTAREMGKLIGQNKKTLVYGGMESGLMGLVANLALENGAQVTGIIPKSLKDSERIHPHLTETILVPDLWERKRKMFERADAVINLAGGYGTADEALEALHWANLGSHAKPIVFVNTENYWDDFLAYIKAAPDLATDHLIIAETPEDAFEKLHQWTPPNEITGDADFLPHYEEDILKENIKSLIFREPTIKQSYILATALGLKQLGRHGHPIGILNDKGQFDLLLRWIDTAQKERFITDRCTLLFDTDTDENTLNAKLAQQPSFLLDLHTEKWGAPETATHIEIKEVI